MFVKKLVHEASNSPLALFTREICNQPRFIGAACPSSGLLARYMAWQVPLLDDRLVVELGAGTGVVTRAMLRHGVFHDNLVVVERSPSLVGHLRKRFPRLRVIHGDAAELVDLLGADAAQVDSVVSSLPLRSLPPDVTRRIGEQVDTLLGDRGLLIQYTYHLRGASPHLPPHFRRVFSKIVWGNLPPALVEVFRRQRDAASALDA